MRVPVLLQPTKLGNTAHNITIQDFQTARTGVPAPLQVPQKIALQDTRWHNVHFGPGVAFVVRWPGMNWNDAAEDFLQQVLSQTPRPVRDAAEAELRGAAEAMAADDGKNRVGVETVIAAWVKNTPETLRPDLPRQMERFGLDPDEYQHLL